MQKPSLAFVDHSFHKKTKSAEFLRELFKEAFEVHDYWDESWHGGPSVPPTDINKHDYVFYLQVINPIAELKKIIIPILWSPMYDGFKPVYPYWKMISQFNIKVLSFSTTMNKWLDLLSIPYIYVQYYYLKPEKIIGPPGNHIFFWYRGCIEFRDIKNIFNPDQIDSFTILEVPDKKGKMIPPTSEEISIYKINHIVESFLPREKYLNLLYNASIFIAPRKKEGIGAFTEALAMGKCVIANDDAVHNEYIINGCDGFLFDKKTQKINLDKVEQISEAAFQRASKSYTQWLIDKEKIIPFVLEPYQAKKNTVTFFFWNKLYKLNQFIAKIRYYIKNICYKHL